MEKISIERGKRGMGKKEIVKGGAKGIH